MTVLMLPIKTFTIRRREEKRERTRTRAGRMTMVGIVISQVAALVPVREKRERKRKRRERRRRRRRKSSCYVIREGPRTRMGMRARRERIGDGRRKTGRIGQETRLRRRAIRRGKRGKGGRRRRRRGGRKRRKSIKRQISTRRRKKTREEEVVDRGAEAVAVDLFSSQSLCQANMNRGMKTRVIVQRTRTPDTILSRERKSSYSWRKVPTIKYGT
mmetsp:Transcript_2010/g.3063  ORF Transcript_2010/g.3063 Transcript_2010/m.3063 type:complete len:215 (+) Transcript_2010:180-824(+)